MPKELPNGSDAVGGADSTRVASLLSLSDYVVQHVIRPLEAAALQAVHGAEKWTAEEWTTLLKALLGRKAGGKP